MTPALTCDELRPLLGGYVLEALEPDEAEAVRAHLRRLPRVRRRARLARRAAAAARPRRAGLAPGRAARARHRGGAARPRRPRVGPRRAARRRAAGCRGSRGRARASRSPAPCSPPRGGAATAIVTRDDGSRAASRRYVVALQRGRGGAEGEGRRIALYRVHGGTGVHLWASGPARRARARLRDAVRAARGGRRARARSAPTPTGRVERAAHDRGAASGNTTASASSLSERDGTTSDVLTGRLF